MVTKLRERTSKIGEHSFVYEGVLLCLAWFFLFFLEERACSQ